MFEFPLSCHVQILDLPARFVKLLAKLSSLNNDQQTSYIFPANFPTISTRLSWSHHPIPLYLFLSPTSLFLSYPNNSYVCIYISSQSPIRRIEKRAMHFIDRYLSLSLSSEIPYPRRMRYLANLSLVFVRPFIFLLEFFSLARVSWREIVVVSKDTLMERILKNKRDVAGTEMKTTANSSFASHLPTITLRLNSKAWWWNESVYECFDPSSSISFKYFSFNFPGLGIGNFALEDEREISIFRVERQ